MRVFYNKILALSALFFSLSVFFFLYFSPIISISFFVGFLIFSIILLIIKKKTHFKFTLFLTVATLFGIIVSSLFSFVFYKNAQSYNEKETTIKATVTEKLSSSSFGSQYKIKVTFQDGKNCQYSALLECEFSASMSEQDIIEANVVGRAFDTTFYDEEQYRLSDGCLCVYTLSDFQNYEVVGKSNSLIYFIKSISKKCSYYLSSFIGDEEGNLASALLLGDRSRLTDYTVLQFRRSGVSHLLALSGLHISIIIGGFYWLLKKWKVHPIIRNILVPVFSIFYLILTGCNYSTARAVFMLCFVFFATIVSYKADSITSLFLSLAIIILIAPYSIFDLGMWLSYTATFSVLVFSQTFSSIKESRKEKTKLSPDIFRALSKITGTIFIGFFTSASLSLLTALFYKSFSLLSVPMTLITTPLVFLSLLLSVFAFIPFMKYPIYFINKVLLLLCDKASSINGILISTTNAISIVILSLLTILLFVFAITKLNKKFLLFVPLLFVLAIFSTLVYNQLFNATLQTTYFNENNGDILLCQEKGNTLVFNFSDGSGTGAKDLYYYLREQGITEIDDLIFSHYHNKDTYFLSQLANKIKINNVCFFNSENNMEIVNCLISVANDYKIQVSSAISNTKIQLNDFEFDTYEWSNNRHTSYYLSFTNQEKCVMYCNCSSLDSPLIENIEKSYSNADLIFISSTGFSTSSEAVLSTPKNNQIVLLQEEKIKSYFTEISNYLIVEKRKNITFKIK